MLELRAFCESLDVRNFPQIRGKIPSIDEWELLEKITSALRPFANLTTLMQREIVSLSDFFGGWGKIKMDLTKLGHDQLARQLLVDMKSREDDLFNNPVLNAAVFLDPRFQMYMPIQKKEEAIEFLSNLHKKIETLAKNDANEPAPSPLPSNELEEFMMHSMYGTNDEDNNNNIDNNDQTTTEENQPSADDIRTTLRKFIGVKEPITSSVFEYWRKNVELKPSLYKLASIIHSVPPTQTTVERAFSAMALILTALRNKLSDKILENMLLIRLNRDNFEDECKFDV